MVRKQGNQETGERSVLLIDFQEPQYASTAVNDLARLLVSGASSETRANCQKQVVEHYVELLNHFLALREDQPSTPVDFKAFNDSLILASITDAVFIIAVIPTSCWADDAFALFHGLVGRSVSVIKDVASEFCSIAPRYGLSLRHTSECV